MIDKIKALCIKYREVIVYLIVGVLTTLVAWGCKFLWNYIFYAGTKLPTVAQNSVLSVVDNVSGIAFAYPTNRSWIMGWLLNMLLVNVLSVSVFISTVVVGVLVVIGNYVFSKLLVFRNKK